LKLGYKGSSTGLTTRKKPKMDIKTKVKDRLSKLNFDKVRIPTNPQNPALHIKVQSGT
jgi:hypothetical protein